MALPCTRGLHFADNGAFASLRKPHMQAPTASLPKWSIAWPLIAWGLLAGNLAGLAGGWWIALLAASLVGAVLSA
ncbi:MAG: hypothetical protein EAZ54_11040, partial [Curvibacter sp.]